MAASIACCNTSPLSSSTLPGSLTRSSSQYFKMRWDLMKTPNFPLASHGGSVVKEQGARGRRSLYVHAEHEKNGGAGDFVAGFLLGGVVFGALSYLFAPQVSKVISGIDRERDESSKKLPKGLDEDEGLEKTRRNLNEKIAQLNAAIDDVSAQLRADDGLGVPDGRTPELETAA